MDVVTSSEERANEDPASDFAAAFMRSHRLSWQCCFEQAVIEFSKQMIIMNIPGDSQFDLNFHANDFIVFF